MKGRKEREQVIIKFHARIVDRTILRRNIVCNYSIKVKMIASKNFDKKLNQGNIYNYIYFIILYYVIIIIFIIINIIR